MGKRRTDPVYDTAVKGGGEGRELDVAGWVDEDRDLPERRVCDSSLSVRIESKKQGGADRGTYRHPGTRRH
jgi:hypothetical protein